MRLAGRLHACAQAAGRVVKSPSQYFDVLWGASRRYWFSLIFISIITAKLLHIYSHLNSLPVRRLLLWGPTFFFQDAVAIFIVRGLTRSFKQKWASIASCVVVVLMGLIISSMAAANTSFYVVTGAEIHWKQANTFHADSAAIRTLLTGLTGFIIVDALFLVISWFATPHLYNAAGAVLQIWSSSIAAVCCCLRKRKPLPDPEVYEQVARDDYDDDKSDDGGASDMLLVSPKPAAKETGRSLLKRFLILVPTLFIIILRIARPPDPSYWFLSKTLIITPFSLKSGKAGLFAHSEDGGYEWLGNHTALDKPQPFSWLPNKNLAGFLDWHAKDRVHYNPENDPLRISNLDQQVLEPLRDALKGGNVNIKHIIFLKLESTRQDVFPVRNESAVLDRIRSSYKNDKIPKEVEERLANLTRTAERLTGRPSGFEYFDPPKPYGGISANNSHTSGTYTLKSITGSLCGVVPLAADFNREYKQHIYQPCLPHIMDALDSRSNKPERTEDYTTWPWHTTFMQSVTEGYDNQNLLTPALGFKTSINQESMNVDRANRTFKGEQVNYYGYPDTELREYVLNAIKQAESQKERMFITHLTGITHHPWGMPGQVYEEMIGQTWYGLNNNLNHYLNTIGFVDRWIAMILDLLQETGIADDTLLVFTGDHGVSLPNDGGVTPYDNPHVGNFHVPLVLSHPKLPQVNLDNSVTSIQILPTILDLLIESGSLDDHSLKALKDLLPLYEGQSLIRPLIAEQDGREEWQFTIMNTGGTWLAVRSAAKPYRLVIPLLPDVEWRFTDLSTDPYELHHVMEFDLDTLSEMVGASYGEVAVKFIQDAAHVSEWWLRENWRRYEWGPGFDVKDDSADHPYSHGHGTYNGPDMGPQPDEEKPEGEQ
ncbi:hypothetical protein AWENTII_011887 [Aspergillus wentii]|nr:hypothetical protein MW887_008361 [Aspergillus wentii]